MLPLYDRRNGTNVEVVVITSVTENLLVTPLLESCYDIHDSVVLVIYTVDVEVTGCVV